MEQKIPYITEGNQELVIILLDYSNSMYSMKVADEEYVPVNKYLAVQDAIEKLLEQIVSTNKKDHILVAIVPFAGKAKQLKIGEFDISYYPSKMWLANSNIKAAFNNLNEDTSEIGRSTSFTEAFVEAKNVAEHFFTQSTIGKEFKHAVSILFFSDGLDMSGTNFLDTVKSILEELNDLVKASITNSENQENFSIASIAIGSDADEDTMIAISTPFTERQSKHLDELKLNSPDVVAAIMDDRCYLKLEAEDGNISTVELKILRKFLFLVTES
ncbi:MAG: VWA domain-containing protein [Bacteroidetes bacterium]|nr:VWA domain-containing protein [Bacteroidota bacterium]